MTNLAALAKVLGYARYFYPQDNISLDWNSITVNGVSEVINCVDDSELKTRLTNILQPFAGQMVIGDSLEVAKNTQLSTKDCSMPNRLQFWQHQGYGLSNNFRHSSYASMLVNAPDSRDVIPNSMSTSFPTKDASIVGQPFNMKIYFRSNAVVSDSTFVLYFNASSGRILLKKPLKILPNKSEKTAVASAVFNELPDMLTISLNLTNVNSLSIDSVCLAYVNNKQHETKLLSDNFKKVNKDNLPVNWYFTGHGYKYSLAKTANNAHVPNLVNNSPILANTLFAYSPKNGETIVSKISPGLYCALPLTLCSNSVGNAGIDFAPYKKNAAKQIDSLHKNLAAVIAAWDAINNFYSYFDVIKTDWYGELLTTLQQTLNTNDQYGFLRVINKMVAKIKDGHASVGGHAPMQFRLPFKVDWIQEKATVVAVDSGVASVKIGDVVLAVDSTDAGEMIQQEEECISGSTQFTRYKAMRQFAYVQYGGTSIIKLLRNDSIIYVDASRSRAMAEDTPQPIFTYPSKKSFGDSIYYYDLSKIGFTELKDDLPKLSKAKGIIFDMRNRPTDTGVKILPYLLSSPDTCNWMHIPLIIYPDHKNMDHFYDVGWHLTAVEPHINGKVAFITNALTISYPESILNIVAYYKLGAIVSETATAGANGDITLCSLPGGYNMGFTGMKVTHLDGTQFHTIGVEPTIKVRRLINSVKQGIDDLFVAALKYVDN